MKVLDQITSFKMSGKITLYLSIWRVNDCLPIAIWSGYHGNLMETNIMSALVLIWKPIQAADNMGPTVEYTLPKQKMDKW